MKRLWALAKLIFCILYTPFALFLVYFVIYPLAIIDSKFFSVNYQWKGISYGDYIFEDDGGKTEYGAPVGVGSAYTYKGAIKQAQVHFHDGFRWESHFHNAKNAEFELTWKGKKYIHTFAIE